MKILNSPFLQIELDKTLEIRCLKLDIIYQEISEDDLHFSIYNIV